VRLRESAVELAGILDAAGIPAVAPTGRLAAPCAVVRPADPWLTSSTVIRGARLASWRVDLLAGAIDAIGQHDALAALVERLVLAFAAHRAWSLSDVSGPVAYDAAGAVYLAVTVTVSAHVQITREDP
jgi:hypothetical protein